MGTATLTLGGTPVVVQVDREVLAVSEDRVPLAYALFVREDAVAMIYGVERIELVAGVKVYALAFIYTGDDLCLMHDGSPRREVTEGQLTWDKQPALIGVHDDPNSFGFDVASTERLFARGLLMSGRGYRAATHKGQRADRVRCKR